MKQLQVRCEYCGSVNAPEEMEKTIWDDFACIGCTEVPNPQEGQS